MMEEKRKTGEEYISAMYDSLDRANQEKITQNYNSALSDLDAEREKLNRNADESARQASVQSAQNQQRWAETAQAGGLSSGADAQARLAQGNQLQQDLTAIRTARDTGEAELERQRSKLAEQYQSAIREAQANGEYQRANALYEAARYRDQELKERAALLAGAGDFSGYGDFYGLTQEQLNLLSRDYTKAERKEVANLMAQVGNFQALQEYYGLSNEFVEDLKKNYSRQDLETAAALMAQAGDFSLYQQLLGLTDEQVATLKSYFNSKNSSGGSSGYSGYSGYSGSSSDDGVYKIIGKDGTYTREEIEKIDEKTGNQMYLYRTGADGTKYYRYSKPVPKQPIKKPEKI